MQILLWFGGFMSINSIGSSGKLSASKISSW